MGTQKVLFRGPCLAPQAAAATASVPALEQGKMQLLGWLRCPTEPSSVAFEGGVGCILKVSLGSEFGPSMPRWDRQHLPPCCCSSTPGRCRRDKQGASPLLKRVVFPGRV